MSEKSDLDPGDLSDRWQQMTEIEAKRVYEITLQNELSGATKAVRDFELVGGNGPALVML